MRRIIALCILIIILSTIACVDSAIGYIPLSETDKIDYSQLALPKKVFIDSEQLGIGEVCFDATVNTPIETSIYEYTVTKKAFTENELKKYIDILCPDSGLYYAWDRSKKEILQEIVDFSEIATNSEMDIQWMEYLKGSLETASDNVHPTKFNWEDIDLSAETWIYSLREGKEMSVICFSNNYFMYNRDNTLSIGLDFFFNEKDPIEKMSPRITESQAKAIAQETLDKMGLSSFKILDDQTIYCVAYRMNRSVEWGYRIILTPILDGLPCVYTDFTPRNKNWLPSVAAPWESECITMYIDSNGLEALIYSSPAAYSMKSNELQYVPFDRIVDRAQRQLLYIYSALDYDVNLSKDLLSQKVSVFEINLIRGTIQTEDNIKEGRNIPLWEIKYIYTWGTNESSIETIYISALDGTYVEPRVVYTDY